jgi:type IV secretory pathway VirB4 component
MLRLEQITREWKEAGSLPAQINLYGFWDEHSFLTKSGDLGMALRIGGMDYESLDHAGRDYATRRLEAAFRALNDGTRLYQVLFKHNRPQVPFAQYENSLVQATVEQRREFLESKADRLYEIEVFWIAMADGKYAKAGLRHALSLLPTAPRNTCTELKSLLADGGQRTFLYEQIERARALLGYKVQSLIGQLNDLIEIELLGAEKAFRLERRFVNFCPSKIQSSKLRGPVHLDWQMCDSELEAHRGHLRMDDYYVRVLTLKELPSETRPLILNGLLDIAANFHVVTEWHPVDNAQARRPRFLFRPARAGDLRREKDYFARQLVEQA